MKNLTFNGHTTSKVQTVYRHTGIINVTYAYNTGKAMGVCQKTGLSFSYVQVYFEKRMGLKPACKTRKRTGISLSNANFFYIRCTVLANFPRP